MTNNLLIESLKRLYSQNKVTVSKLNDLKKKGTISSDDYDYIVLNKKVGD